MLDVTKVWAVPLRGRKGGVSVVVDLAERWEYQRVTRSVLGALFDGVQPLDVASPFDVFNCAARFTRGEDPPPYQVLTGSLGGVAVRAAGGLQILPDLDLEDAGEPDILVVPGGPGAEVPDERMVRWLRERASGADRVMSVCTGAYLLAAAGLLEGRRATTHWAYCADLAQKFPNVEVDPLPIFVRDGAISTSAGVISGVDLALALVEEDLGQSVAQEVARLLVVYLRRPGSQAQVSVQLSAQIARSNPLREVQYWAAENLAGDLSVPSLAIRAGLSPRHFARAFALEVGVTPGRYVDLLRLEAAQRMLADTVDGVTRISRACGYGSAEVMRRAFVRELRLSPTQYRDTFHRANQINTPI